MNNLTDTSRFLQAVFGPDYGTAAIYANLDPSFHTRDWTKLDPSRSCYWSIAAFLPGAKTNREDDALETRALVIDDVGTKVPALAVEMALGVPTAVVESSAGNFQWAYRLSTPIQIADWGGFFAGVEALIKPPKPLEARSAQSLMRLPMGRNTKTERRNAQGIKVPVPVDEQNFQVRLVELNTLMELVVETIPRQRVAAGPGPSLGASSGGGGTVRDIRGLMALIPNNDLEYDPWLIRMERCKAIAIDKEDAWEVFAAWSAQSRKDDPAETARRWATVEPSRTSGKELLTEAEAADGEGFRAWQARESAEMFDDGAAPPPASGGGGGCEFFVDQEKSSIAVVEYLAGRLKQVGRGEWREFDEVTGRWREWTGDHMLRRVLELVNERKQRALDPEVSKKLGSVKFIQGIVQAASVHRSVIARTTDFDRGALLLGVPSGVIELGKGKARAVRAGRATEMVSKSMWVDPAPAGTPHPVWSKFLAEFTQGDASLEEWLQVRAGYCLTGLMDEYIMPFYHGSGGNGKSVYLNALRSVWGEYGTQMEHRLLFEKAGGYHLAPLAMLAGVRLAIVTDVPQAASWDVHIMKMLTGDDAITANRMHQNPITFKSTAKVDVSGNGEPVVKDMDEGVRRRLKLIPLTAVPKSIDKQLSRKLLDEYPAILSWALVGLDMYWGLGGMPASKTVDVATKEYHDLLDPFQRWLDTGVEKDPTQGAKVSATDLFQAWDSFRVAEGAYGVAPANKNALCKKMREKGFVFSTVDGYSWLRGYKVVKSTASAAF